MHPTIAAMLNSAFPPSSDTAPLLPDFALLDPELDPAMAPADKVGVNTAEGLAMHDVPTAEAVAEAAALTVPFPSNEHAEASRPLSSKYWLNTYETLVTVGAISQDLCKEIEQPLTRIAHVN